jgi:hypothetical protein
VDLERIRFRADRRRSSVDVVRVRARASRELSRRRHGSSDWWRRFNAGACPGCFRVDWNPAVKHVLAFALILIAVMIAGAFVARMLSSAVRPSEGSSIGSLALCSDWHVELRCS